MIKSSVMSKSILCLIVGVFIFTSIIPLVNAAYTIEDQTQVEQIPVQITINEDNRLTELSYKISGYKLNTIQINNEVYYGVDVGDESKITLKGYPELPDVRRSIVIDDTLKPKINVIDSEFIDYENILIAPSKGHLLRDINPKDVPFEFSDCYQKDTWFPQSIAELGEPYIIRDLRGVVVKVNPLQYNPVTKKLRFYTDVSVEITYDGEDNRNVIDRVEPISKVDVDFQSIYDHHFLNYQRFTRRYTPVSEQGNMLVISYDGFVDDMQSFVEWKNTKGIPTEMVTRTQAGGTATAIKTYISNYYQQHGLTFVLLVGDIDQMPSLWSLGYASDPSYSYVAGSDHYPDLFVGRFSANNEGELLTQVERSIEYEKYPELGASWYQKGVGIASNEGTGDDNEFDWEHMRNIRTDLLNYHYTGVDELYDGSHGGQDQSGNPYSSMVSSVINSGRGIINYCGHGSAHSWSSTGFSTTYVNQLTNVNQLPFIWSVACSNGEFDYYTTCFAEAWLRATYNGEPTGAVGVFMSSRGQYWSPPMAAQDHMVDLLVESYVQNNRNTFGGLSFSGCMHMNDEYNWFGDEGGYDMTDTWHIFGDPSLQVRTDTPQTLSVVHDETMPEEATSFEVSVPGLQDALCALSYDTELLGYAYTDEDGDVSIVCDNPIVDVAAVDLVVTSYNGVPYMTSIPVVGFECGDTNGDNTVDVGDAIYTINYIFRGGPAPEPYCVGDVNSDGLVNVGDAVHIIAYIFRGGPAPVDDCCE